MDPPKIDIIAEFSLANRLPKNLPLLGGFIISCPQILSLRIIKGIIQKRTFNVKVA